MPKNYSLTGLHLRYRLWISELNHYIDVIRIATDFLSEAKTKQSGPDIADGIKYFQKQFILLRKEIDELRNTMHLIKMKIAADAKKIKEINTKTYTADDHPKLKKEYLAFMKKFNTLIKEFSLFEENYF